MKFFGSCIIALGWVATASAALTSAIWSTDPVGPVYAGQPYELVLTIETGQDEEVSDVRLEQGPGRAPDRQETRLEKGRRFTMLRWKQQELRPKLVTIPEGRLQAAIMHIQTFGFMRTASTRSQMTMIPSFDYEVQALPGEASGLPIGSFELNLTSDASTFIPGEVRVLTARLSAHTGIVPERCDFSLADTTSGELYPFRVVTRTERELIAQAYYVTATDQDIALRLNALKAFDLKTRQVVEVTSPTLLLRATSMEQQAPCDATVTIGGTSSVSQGTPLRFAPTEGAPVIGVLEMPYHEEATYDGWSRVRTPFGSGWIRSRMLKGAL